MTKDTQNGTKEMSSEQREKLFERIKKLMKLSKSSNPHEAAVALNMAINLMKSSGITFNDIGLSEIKKAFCRTTLTSANSRVPIYEDELVCLIKKAFGVMFIYSWLDNRKCYEFFGPGSRVETAAYATEVLVRQLKTARRNYMKELKDQDPLYYFYSRRTKTAMGDTYSEGWVQGVSKLVTDFTTITKEEQELMEKFKKKEYPKLEAIKARWSYGESSSEFSDGVRDGKKAYLHHPVDGSDAGRYLTYSR